MKCMQSQKFLNEPTKITAPDMETGLEDQILGTKKHFYFLFPLHSSATLLLELRCLPFVWLNQIQIFFKRNQVSLVFREDSLFGEQQLCSLECSIWKRCLRHNQSGNCGQNLTLQGSCFSTVYPLNVDAMWRPFCTRIVEKQRNTWKLAPRMSCLFAPWSSIRPPQESRSQNPH